MARPPSGLTLVKAIAFGLGGVIAAPSLIVVFLVDYVLRQQDGLPTQSGELVFAAGGAVILAIAIRALRRRDEAARWAPGRLMRRALAPCIVVGVALAGYFTCELVADHREIVGGYARELCATVHRANDDACVVAAKRCGRLNRYHSDDGARACLRGAVGD